MRFASRCPPGCACTRSSTSRSAPVSEPSVVDAREFEAIARDAETLLGASDLGVGETRALAARARAASDFVPVVRRDDWRTLLGGFDRDEPAERRRARLEGLLRACAAFRA